MTEPDDPNDQADQADAVDFLAFADSLPAAMTATRQILAAIASDRLDQPDAVSFTITDRVGYALGVAIADLEARLVALEQRLEPDESPER